MTLEKFMSMSEEGKIIASQIVTPDTLRGWLNVATDNQRAIIETTWRERNRRRASSQEMPSEALENARSAVMSASVAFKRASSILRRDA